MIDKFANDGPLGQNDGPFTWQIGQGRESADKSLYISKYYLGFSIETNTTSKHLAGCGGYWAGGIGRRMDRKLSEGAVER